jgi:hypothetical protein
MSACIGMLTYRCRHAGPVRENEREHHQQGKQPGHGVCNNVLVGACATSSRSARAHIIAPSARTGRWVTRDQVQFGRFSLEADRLEPAKSCHSSCLTGSSALADATAPLLECLTDLKPFARPNHTPEYLDLIRMAVVRRIEAVGGVQGARPNPRTRCNVGGT